MVDILFSRPIRDDIDISIDQWESLYLLALRLGAGDEGGDLAILDQPDHPEEKVAVLGIQLGLELLEAPEVLDDADEAVGVALEEGAGDPAEVGILLGHVGRLHYLGEYTCSPIGRHTISIGQSETNDRELVLP